VNSDVLRVKSSGWVQTY